MFTGLRNTEGRFMWRFSGQTGGPADDSAGSGGTDGGATGGNAGGGGNANPGFVYVPTTSRSLAFTARIPHAFLNTINLA
jgi:hypothetical protein